MSIRQVGILNIFRFPTGPSDAWQNPLLWPSELRRAGLKR